MKSLVILLALLMLATGACSPAATQPPPTQAPATDVPASPSPEPNDAVTPEATADAPVESTQTASVDAPLRVSVIPVINILPLLVAEREGFYADQGIEVEIVGFRSTSDRDEAMLAGEIDGQNTDLVSMLHLIDAGGSVRAVRSDPPTTPYFSIVAGADSGIETVEDLRGVEIAVSNNSIIEYLTRELLLAQGFTEDDLNFQQVRSIDSRLEQLRTGQIAAATLPEPMTSLAVAQGAHVVLNDEAAPFVPTVLAFSAQAIAERPDDIRAFLRAYERAVQAINADTEQLYRDLFIQTVSIPEALRDTYQVPTYSEASVLNEEQVASVVNWMVERGLLNALSYEEVVDPSFLPETAAAS